MNHTHLAILVGVYAFLLLVGVPVWVWLSGRLEKDQW
jgi:hypothetical protein